MSLYKVDVPDDGAVHVETHVSSVEPKPRQPKGCLAVIAIVVIMIGILVAGAITSNSLANLPPKPIDIGHGVTVTAPWSWVYQGRGGEENTVVLSRGNGSLAVTVKESTDPTAALQALKDEWSEAGLITMSDIQPVPDLRPGDNVLRFVYTGNFEDIAGAAEGEVTAVATDSLVVVFDGWADVGDYVTARDEIDTMIKDATIP